MIAANAGGAWSPIGDVTTTMLWIGGQISAQGVITQLFIPSLICLLVPLIVLSFRLHGEAPRPRSQKHLGEKHPPVTTDFERNLVLALGLGAYCSYRCSRPSPACHPTWASCSASACCGSPPRCCTATSSPSTSTRCR